jgi:hypothetical protein
MNGMFAISSCIGFNVAFDYHISDQSDEDQISLRHIAKGVTLLSLRKGCSARSEYFELPTYVVGEYNLEIEASFWKRAKLPWATPPIWDGPIATLSNLSQLTNYTRLEPISDLPFESLQNLLWKITSINSAGHVREHREEVYRNMLIAMVIVIVTIVLCISGFVFLCKRYTKLGNYGILLKQKVTKLTSLNEIVSNEDGVNECMMSEYRPSAQADLECVVNQRVGNDDYESMNASVNECNREIIEIEMQPVCLEEQSTETEETTTATETTKKN